MKNRKPDSHKGENGKVLVVGGNELFHGAPILCALGAEYSGADLVFPFVPYIHAEVARTYSLNFIVNSFDKDHLTNKDVDHILGLSENVDVVVLGPGLGNRDDTQKALKTLFKKLKKPTVVDASALVYSPTYPEVTVLTPHSYEFKKLTGEEADEKSIQKWAKDMGVTIVCKGSKDIIADKDDIMINEAGNAMMTVGGTGDVLSGLIGGLMAQGHEPCDAGMIATNALGKIAEALSESQASIRAHEIAQLIPVMLFKED